MEGYENNPTSDPLVDYIENAVDTAVEMLLDAEGIARRHPVATTVLGGTAILVGADVGTGVVYIADDCINGPWSTQAEAISQPGWFDSLVITGEQGAGFAVGIFGVLAVTAAVLKYRVTRRK
jgi:hypothetical protein